MVARRADRWESGRFVAEGPKLVQEALTAGAEVQTLYLDPAGADESHQVLAALAHRAGAELVEVEPGVLARACDTVTPQPLVAVVGMVHIPLQTAPAAGLTVVCAGLQDPGNAGTVLRTAVASGAVAVVFGKGAVDVYNPKTVRSSAGAIFRVPLVCGPPPQDVVAHLRTRPVPVRGTVVRGGRPHDDVDWTGPAALVLGSESHGLGDDVEALVDERVTIPMAAGTESLNVAMAAAGVCFEAARQRRVAGQGAT